MNSIENFVCRRGLTHLEATSIFKNRSNTYDRVCTKNEIFYTIMHTTVCNCSGWDSFCSFCLCTRTIYSLSKQGIWSQIKCLFSSRGHRITIVIVILAIFGQMKAKSFFELCFSCRKVTLKIKIWQISNSCSVVNSPLINLLFLFYLAMNLNQFWH